MNNDRSQGHGVQGQAKAKDLNLEANAKDLSLKTKAAGCNGLAALLVRGRFGARPLWL